AQIGFPQIGVGRMMIEQPVVGDDLRLQFQQCRQPRCPRGCHADGRVPPKNVYRTVIGEQFPHLRNRDVVDIFVETTVLRIVPMPRGWVAARTYTLSAAAGRATRVVPILCLRVIESQSQTVLLTGSGKLMKR